MAVAAAEEVEVEVEATVVGERPEEVLEELGRHVTDPPGAEDDAEMQPGPSGEVDHAAREGLVEGAVGVAEAGDPRLVPERDLEGLAEGDPDVLHRMMGVDVQVPPAAQLEIEPGVRGERREHVVEEADARRHLRSSRAVQVERERDVRLARLPLDRRPARPHHALPCRRRIPASTSADPSAWRKASFSSSVPTLTRRQRDRMGCAVMSRTSTPRRWSEAKTALGSAASSSSRKKFAREGQPRMPCMSFSLAISRSRAATIRATASARAEASRIASIAAVSEKTLRLWGRRALFTSRTSSGAARRYPIRSPASAIAFENVRSTTRLGHRSRSGTAVAPANSWEASSTTTMPPPARHGPSISG